MKLIGADGRPPTVPKVDLLAGHAEMSRLLVAGCLSGLLVAVLPFLGVMLNAVIRGVFARQTLVTFMLEIPSLGRFLLPAAMAAALGGLLAWGRRVSIRDHRFFVLPFMFGGSYVWQLDKALGWWRVNTLWGIDDLIGLSVGTLLAVAAIVSLGPRWGLAAPLVIILGLLFTSLWLAVYKRLVPLLAALTLTEEIEYAVWHVLTLSDAMEVFRATSVKYDPDSQTLTVMGDPAALHGQWEHRVRQVLRDIPLVTRCGARIVLSAEPEATTA